MAGKYLANFTYLCVAINAFALTASLLNFSMRCPRSIPFRIIPIAVEDTNFKIKLVKLTVLKNVRTVLIVQLIYMFIKKTSRPLEH